MIVTTLQNSAPIQGSVRHTHAAFSPSPLWLWPAVRSSEHAAQQQSFERMLDDGLRTAETAFTLFTLRERCRPNENEFSFSYQCLRMPVSPHNNLIVIRRKQCSAP